MNILDTNFTQNVLEKVKLFRQLQIWPNKSELDYVGWLSNFKEKEERELASIILNFFIYYSKEAISKLLKEAIGRAGHKFKETIPDWNHSFFKTKCIYTFIPGEKPHPCDSGYLFTRKLRDELHIPAGQIKEYANVHAYLVAQTEPICVIFVDDFVGTGQQCCKAWNVNKDIATGLTLSEIAKLKKHQFVYAPLIANKMGADKIRTECENLTLSVVHELGYEYNLFRPECNCWEDITKYRLAVELIYRKSEEIGITSLNGENSIYGFNAQGLAIAFEHGIPDAVPAIFYWADNGWIPLMNRVYGRH